MRKIALVIFSLFILVAATSPAQAKECYLNFYKTGVTGPNQLTINKFRIQKKNTVYTLCADIPDASAMFLDLSTVNEAKLSCSNVYIQLISPSGAVYESNGSQPGTIGSFEPGQWKLKVNMVEGYCYSYTFNLVWWGSGSGPKPPPPPPPPPAFPPSPPGVPPVIPDPTRPSAIYPGCDPTAWEAMSARSRAYGLRDIAWTRQMIPQPESTMFSTCFPQAAKIAAKRGANIFSGDFLDDVNNVIGTEVSIMALNMIDTILWRLPFLADALEYLSDLPFVGILIGGEADPVYECDLMRTLWEEGTMNGVDSYVSYFDFDDLMSGSPSGLGDVGLENIKRRTDVLDWVITKEDILMNSRAAPIFTSPMTLEDVIKQSGLGAP